MKYRRQGVKVWRANQNYTEGRDKGAPLLALKKDLVMCLLEKEAINGAITEQNNR